MIRRTDKSTIFVKGRTFGRNLIFLFVVYVKILKTGRNFTVVLRDSTILHNKIIVTKHKEEISRYK